MRFMVIQFLTTSTNFFSMIIGKPFYLWFSLHDWMSFHNVLSLGFILLFWRCKCRQSRRFTILLTITRHVPESNRSHGETWFKLSLISHNFWTFFLNSHPFVLLVDNAWSVRKLEKHTILNFQFAGSSTKFPWLRHVSDTHH